MENKIRESQFFDIYGVSAWIYELQASSSKLINEFFLSSSWEESVTSLQSTKLLQKSRSLLVFEYSTLNYDWLTFWLGNRRVRLDWKLNHLTIWSWMSLSHFRLDSRCWEVRGRCSLESQWFLFWGRIFVHVIVFVSRFVFGLTVRFSSNFYRRYEVLRIGGGIPYRNLRCSYLVHLPLVLGLILTDCYMAESLEEF